MYRLLFALLALLSTGLVHAADGVPAALEPWREWVLQDQQFRQCSLIAGRPASAAQDFLCAWPGLLSIDADDAGAEISQHWKVEADSWIPLPGSSEQWPQQVRVNGRPMAVVDRDGPELRLAAGDYDIRARLDWQQRPQSLRVPVQIGLVALHVDGKPVLPIQRDHDELKLGRGASTESESDSIHVRVHRKLVDGVPLQLITEITVQASGQAREEVLGPALPDGFLPLSLESEEWPARLDGEGRLHVQVQPGMDTVTLSARALAPMDQVVARLPAEWATQEIWSYEAQPTLRVTHVSGKLQVDPQQADVPYDWRDLPAFALADGDQLQIEQRSRGMAADEHNRLTLKREAWLDFSGAGWSTRDHIIGRMLSDWRLDVVAPYALQRAASVNQGGASEPLLVTRSEQDGANGVEWRTPTVNLMASVRIEGAAARMPVTGWQQTFDQVTTELHLPHGYRLLAAPGTDSAEGSWISAWTLLDIFIVAIIVLLTGRVLGRIGAVAMAAFLILSCQESGAPLWSLLLLLALVLLARLLPKGRLARVSNWARIAALALLVLIALPFAAQQLRQAIYPQLEVERFRPVPVNFLERPDVFVAETGEVMVRDDPAKRMPMALAAPPAPPAPPSPASGRSSDKLESIVVTGSRIRQADLMSRYSESTVIQTGAGEPEWDMRNNYQLSWSGPVLATQDVRLLIAPPWLLRSLRVLMIVLLGGLIWRLASGSTWPWRAAKTSAAHGAVAGLVLGTLLLSSMPASAQVLPTPEMLQQLKSRLTEAPPCAPDCALIAQAEVLAQGDQLRMALEVHALQPSALPIPFDERAMQLRSVLLDGVAQDGVQGFSGKRWLAIPRGVHRVELIHDTLVDSVSLAFPLPPQRISFRGDGWQASGLADQRLLAETLRVTRVRAETEQRQDAQMQQFSPYVRVTRTLRLDQEWHLDNRVQRLAPSEGGFSVDLPVLKGEHVSSAGVRVRDGQITLAMAEDQDTLDWISTLDQAASISFTAPDLAARAEVWQIVVGPRWHMQFDGVPEVGLQANSRLDDFRVFEFHPLPGETLTVQVSRPSPTAGAALAIDRVDLVSEYAQRASTHELALRLRASQGGEHALRLPQDSRLLAVTRNGQSVNLRDKEGVLSLPITPGGEDFRVRWREDAGIGSVARTPALALGLPAANIAITLQLPADRWLLAAFGPSEGPALLFWGELLIVIALAWLLSRWQHSPLRLWQWLLLVLGFSTFSWWPLVLVVAWLFALQWRARGPLPANPGLFNLVQIGLGVLSVIAVLCLFASISNGLLGRPDMLVNGNGSDATALRWFADRSVDALPDVTVLSLPLWVFRTLMLAWALWLAWALMGWLRQGFNAWMSGGYWRATRKQTAVIDIPDVAPPQGP